MTIRRAKITDHHTSSTYWQSHAYAAALVASDPLRYNAAIGKALVPLLRDPFTAPHHIQIEDCAYIGAQ